MVKDKKRNGGRDFAALLKHVGEDKLVLWGWEPGGERAPVSASTVRRPVRALGRRRRTVPGLRPGQSATTPRARTALPPQASRRAPSTA